MKMLMLGCGRIGGNNRGAPWMGMLMFGSGMQMCGEVSHLH
jgi:hypothetical protein